MKIDERIKQVILKAQQGDRDAFEQLYRTFYGEVYSTARYILKSETKAEDVLQETFIKVFLKLHELSSPEAFPSWLYQITYNECRMLWRKKDEKVIPIDTQSEDYSNIVDVDAEIPSFSFETEEERDLVKKEVEKLPLHYRTVIVYFYYLNLSVKEIATILSCNENTVKGRLFSARNILKKNIIHLQTRLGFKLALSMVPLSQFLGGKALEHPFPTAAGRDVLATVLTKIGFAGTGIGQLFLMIRIAFRKLMGQVRQCSTPIAAGVSGAMLLGVIIGGSMGFISPARPGIIQLPAFYADSPRVSPENGGYQDNTLREVEEESTPSTESSFHRLQSTLQHRPPHSR